MVKYNFGTHLRATALGEIPGSTYAVFHASSGGAQWGLFEVDLDATVAATCKATTARPEQTVLRKLANYGFSRVPEHRGREGTVGFVLPGVRTRDEAAAHRFERCKGVRRTLEEAGNGNGGSVGGDGGNGGRGAVLLRAATTAASPLARIDNTVAARAAGRGVKRSRARGDNTSSSGSSNSSSSKGAARAADENGRAGSGGGLRRAVRRRTGAGIVDADDDGVDGVDVMPRAAAAAVHPAPAAATTASAAFSAEDADEVLLQVGMAFHFDEVVSPARQQKQVAAAATAAVEHRRLMCGVPLEAEDMGVVEVADTHVNKEGEMAVDGGDDDADPHADDAESETDGDDDDDDEDDDGDDEENGGGCGPVLALVDTSASACASAVCGGRGVGGAASPPLDGPGAWLAEHNDAAALGLVSSPRAAMIVAPFIHAVRALAVDDPESRPLVYRGGSLFPAGDYDLRAATPEPEARARDDAVPGPVSEMWQSWIDLETCFDDASGDASGDASRDAPVASSSSASVPERCEPVASSSSSASSAATVASSSSSATSAAAAPVASSSSSSSSSSTSSSSSAWSSSDLPSPSLLSPCEAGSSGAGASHIDELLMGDVSCSAFPEFAQTITDQRVPETRAPPAQVDIAAAAAAEIDGDDGVPAPVDWSVEMLLTSDNSLH